MAKESEEKKQKLPQIKKDIETFLSSEEAQMSKKAIVTGAITAAMLGIATDALAGHGSHGSSNQSRLHNSASVGRHLSHAVHNSHGSHNSW